MTLPDALLVPTPQDVGLLVHLLLGIHLGKVPETQRMARHWVARLSKAEHALVCAFLRSDRQ